MKTLDPTIAALVRQQTGASWSRARQFCIDGRVTVDGQRCVDPASRVSADAVVTVNQEGPKFRATPLPESAIVFFDRDVVVVDKPVGMLSVADEQGNKDTLVDYTRTMLRRVDKSGADAPLAVVHRIDKETSGLMMFARTAHAKQSLQVQFREHTIERVYHGIAHGTVGAAVRVETHLLLDRGDGMRGSHGHFRRTGAPPPADAKRAITHVRPIAALAGATLVECRLETGRQHQIRIHLSELGHPLVGERVYIRDYTARKIDAARPMLHAQTLGFIHPRTGQHVVFEREPPDDFRSIVQLLGSTHE